MWRVVCMYAIFSSSFPITKVLLKFTTPIFLTGVRMTLAGLLMLGYCIWKYPHRLYFKKEDRWIFVQLVVLCIYLSYMARFWALNYLTAVKGCFFFNFSPLLSSYFSYLLFKEKISKRQWLGFFFSFLALIPILLTSSPAEARLGEFWFISWPEIAMLFSVAASSYQWVLMRKLMHDPHYSPLMVNGSIMATGGVLALCTAWSIEGFYPVTSSTSFFSYLAAVILISNIISANFYSHLLRSFTATFLSLAGFMSPLFAAFYGWLFLGETVSWHFYVSALILLLGLYLFYQDELREQKTKEPDELA